MFSVEASGFSLLISRHPCQHRLWPYCLLSVFHILGAPGQGFGYLFARVCVFHSLENDNAVDA